MEKKSLSLRVIKLLLVIIIPLLFLATLTFLMMSLFGLNVKEEMKSLGSHLPIVSNATDEKAKNKTVSGPSVSSLKGKIAEQTKTIESLKAQISSQSDKISGMEKDAQVLKADKTKKDKTAESQAKLQQASMVAQTYKTMDPEKAGAIFAQMDNKEAANFLNMLDNKTKTKILENIPAKKAAALTPLLKAASLSGDNSQTATNGGG